MIWIIGAGCFLAGAAVGALLFKLFLSDEVRIRGLEERLQSLSDEHEAYRGQVHGHFSSSAQLLDKLTASYRDVYQHMADNARTLCPDYISSQLSLDRDTRSLLGSEPQAVRPPQDSGPQPAPPRDYATKSGPQQKGSLSEHYGFNTTSEEPPAPPDGRGPH